MTRLLPPLRMGIMGNKVRSASDDWLRCASDWCVTLEVLFAILVATGVIAEVEIALRHPPYDSLLEQWGSVICNGVVAVGVAMETLFLGLGHFIQGEISTRSAGRLAKATKLAGEANERAANTEFEAARLRKEASWRMLPAAIQQALLARLSLVTGSIVVESLSSDHESQNLADQFAALFEAAGWTAVRRRFSTPEQLLFGTLVSLPSETNEPSTKAVVEAFTVAKVPFAQGPLPVWYGFMSTSGTPAPTSARMYVGPKTPMLMQIAPMMRG